MDERILSFEVGAKKPKKRMYDAIFERTDVGRDEVFYVDDMAPYVEQAREMGIKGLVFKEAPDLRKALEAEGVCEDRLDKSGRGQRTDRIVKVHEGREAKSHTNPPLFLL